MLLTTGTIFIATDKLGHQYIYKFIGVDTESSTGCDYVRLLNLSLGNYLGVEQQWFSERKIQHVVTGNYVRNADNSYAKIHKLSAFLSDTHLEVVPKDHFGLVRESDVSIWSWGDVVDVFPTLSKNKGE